MTGHRGNRAATCVCVCVCVAAIRRCVITIFYDLGVSTVRAESLASSQTAAMLDFREERLSKWGVRGDTVQDTCKDLLTKGRNGNFDIVLDPFPTCFSPLSYCHPTRAV